MALSDAFQPLGGEYHASLSSTPLAPFRVLHPDGSGASQLRIVLTNVSLGNVKIAWGSSVAEVTAIAGSGGDSTAGKQTNDVMTFLGPSEIEALSIPNGAWLTAWCITNAATADLYLTPGAGV